MFARVNCAQSKIPGKTSHLYQVRVHHDTLVHTLSPLVISLQFQQTNLMLLKILV